MWRQMASSQTGNVSSCRADIEPFIKLTTFFYVNQSQSWLTYFDNIYIYRLNSFFQIGVITGSVEHRLGMRIIGSKG